MFSVIALNPGIEKDGETWKVVFNGSLAEAAEGDPGAGNGGFLEIFFVNHSATPTTAYGPDRNDSSILEGWCTAGYGYASADNFNLQISSGVTFDIVVRVRYNREQAYETDHWQGSDTRVNITTTGGGIEISDVTGTRIETHNDSSDSYLWEHFVWDNGGSGYQLNAGETMTLSEISIEAKY